MVLSPLKFRVGRVRAVLTLYYQPTAATSLCVRLMLVEKQLPFRRRMLTADEPPAAAAGDLVGGWARLPVLVDDTFSIADPMVIAGYLEDSYPRPNLLPSGARGRAEVRMAMLRIDADLLIPVEPVGRPPRGPAHRLGGRGTRGALYVEFSVR